MTYNPDIKAVFIHIPRTGGSSIKRILRDVGGFSEEMTHADFRYVKEKLGNEWKNYFKFSIVRNPFSRMVSWYNWLVYSSKLGKDKRGRIVQHPGTFENFLFNYNRIYKKDRMTGYTFKKQQVEFIGNKMDFVGRFENLQEDFDYICKRIGMKNIKLPVRKKTEETDYKSYYTRKLRDYIIHTFYDDLKTFGYTF